MICVDNKKYLAVVVVVVVVCVIFYYYLVVYYFIIRCACIYFNLMQSALADGQRMD